MSDKEEKKGNISHLNLVPKEEGEILEVFDCIYFVRSTIHNMSMDLIMDEESGEPDYHTLCDVISGLDSVLTHLKQIRWEFDYE